MIFRVLWAFQVTCLFNVFSGDEVNIFSEDQVPGIQYLSRGYNIMFGNPHSTGNIDPGINGAIFDLSNCSNGQTYNGYSIPNGVSILGSPTCVESFTYNSISGVNSYSESLSESVSFDAKAFGAAFSASSDYQSVYATTTKTSSVYTSSYTQCSCYLASMNTPYDLPSFSVNFRGEVEHIPVEYNPANATNVQFFYDFFTKYFGTHYITNIEMGGIFGTLSSMDSFSYSKFTSSNLNIQASASYSTIAASAAASSMTDKQKQEAEDFNSITKTQQIFNIGGNLPANNNASQWQQSLSTKPMPIKFKLDTIPKLLTSDYFPNDVNILKKQSALQSALDAYCSLLAKNETFGKIDCSGYPPDPSLPGQSIIKGLYSDNIDGEPTNPYTDDHNCPIGYTPIKYGHWMSNNNHAYNSFYCLNATMKFKDELNYFGGFYSTENNYGTIICQISNEFTGDCTCPTGFAQQKAAGGASPQYAATAHLCYNQSVELSKTIIGGMYSIDTNGRIWINPYTKTTSCPQGFTAFKTARSTTGYPSKKQSYICLNNIYVS